jgi:hypothetical protein
MSAELYSEFDCVEAAHPDRSSALIIAKYSFFIESPLIKTHEMSINMLVKDARKCDPEPGCQVTLVSNAHTTEDSETAKAIDLIADKNSSFTKIGEVLKTSEISF